MTMTDDRLARTQTGRLVRAKVAAALHQQFDTGCSKSLAKLLALDGGETKEMLTDLLFKATGLEKVAYFDQRIITAFTRVLETGESLLGTGIFKNIALLETAIVKATGVPFARVDFNVVGNHWIKRFLSFSAENLGGDHHQNVELPLTYFPGRRRRVLVLRRCLWARNSKE